MLAVSFEVASEDVLGIAFVDTPEAGTSAADSILTVHSEPRDPPPYVQKVRKNLGERAQLHAPSDRVVG